MSYRRKRLALLLGTLAMTGLMVSGCGQKGNETKDAKEYFRSEELILWKSTQLESKETNLAIFNISENPLEVCPADYMQVIGGIATDLWTDKKLLPMDTITVPSHGVLLIQTDSVLK